MMPLMLTVLITIELELQGTRDERAKIKKEYNEGSDCPNFRVNYKVRDWNACRSV